MRGLLLFFLLMTFLSMHAYAQGDVHKRAAPPPRSRQAMPRAVRASLPSPISESAGEIKAARTEIPYSILYKDGRVVQEALPTIRGLYRHRGFTKRDADAATLYGWRQLRLTKLAPTAVLSTNGLIDVVSGFG